MGGTFPLLRAPRLLVGLLIALCVGALICALIAIIWQAADLFGNPKTSSIDIFHLLRMSAIQAGLSVLLAFVTGSIVAIALTRLTFFGKPFVLAFLSAGLVLPTLVVAFGLLAIWGRAGLINDIGQSVGLGKLPFTIFGLQGILAAHTILNGSFAARIFYDRLQALPSASLKLGQSLGLSEWQRFTILDWPVLKSAMPGLGATIFLMCFTSFSVVLLLGGGPANATFEVAIFEAVKLDFDLHRAALLAAAQLAFCLFIIIPTAGLKSNSVLIGASQNHLWAATGKVKWIIGALLFVLMLTYASPLLIILYEGFDPAIFKLISSRKFLNALATSCVIATASATIALTCAMLLAFARAELIYQNAGATSTNILRTVISAPVFAYLATPSIVLALGFFLLARFAGLDTSKVGIYVVVIANALLALPLANATLGPPVEKIANKHFRLVKSLNINGWRRFRFIELPLIRKECAYVFALGFSYSFGDLGVIALFGTDDFSTLPWMMYRALGAYRSNDAAMLAAILLFIAVFSFYIFPKILGGRDNAHLQ
ncbi:hypothetical protein [Maritalea porphyrae]|uniref:hypothetical protein n=1 Tax=Maritalea porphyrae TaxID=880732 RepID=UPI0022B04A0C|nr:hypothetical protein [Maritalea porphyrae]MCZ4273650.1 hypothetical protein [Maritalea porphyrae]